MKHDLEYHEKMKAESMRILKSLRKEPNIAEASSMKYVQEIWDHFEHENEKDAYIMAELCVLSCEHFADASAHPRYHIYLVDAFLADKEYDDEWSELKQQIGQEEHPSTLRVTVWGHKNEELDKKFQTIRSMLKCPVHKLKSFGWKNQLEGEVDGRFILKRESFSKNNIVRNQHDLEYYKRLMAERLMKIRLTMKVPVIFVVDDPMTYVREIQEYFNDHESKSDARYIMVHLCVLRLGPHMVRDKIGYYHVDLVDDFLSSKKYEEDWNRYVTEHQRELYPSALRLTIWSPKDEEIEKKFPVRTSVKCPVHLLTESKGEDGDQEPQLQAQVPGRMVLNFA